MISMSARYEPKPPYSYKAVTHDDPKGEKYGRVTVHQIVNRDGELRATFLAEETARYWARVMNEYHEG